jgi:hypothetical protein
MMMKQVSNKLPALILLLLAVLELLALVVGSEHVSEPTIFLL